MKLFAVRDVKADAFGAPVSLQTRGLALRGFRDVCARGESDMARYPSDYMLYELGEYEPNTGRLVGHPVPVFVASAVEMIEAIKAERLKVEPTLPGVPEGAS